MSKAKKPLPRQQLSLKPSCAALRRPGRLDEQEVIVAARLRMLGHRRPRRLRYCSNGVDVVRGARP